MRGRSPTRRSRSRSSSSSYDYDDDDYDDDHSNSDETNTSSSSSSLSSSPASSQEHQHLILFFKCLVFSIVSTILILYVLHPQELTHVFRQGYQKVLVLLLRLFPTTKKSHSLYSHYHHHDDENKIHTQTNDDGDNAIVHVITIPESCRKNKNKCQDDTILPNLISTRLKEAFQSDGVIAIRGIFTPDEIDRLKQTSHDYIYNQTNININTSSTSNTSTSSYHRSGSAKQFFLSKYSIALQQEDFRYIALQSMLPHIVAELLWEYNDVPQRRSNELEEEVGKEQQQQQQQQQQLKEKDVHHSPTHHPFPSSTLPSSLRMIRDVLLVKDQDPFICGWHVDDVGFWPATYDSPGINAWIAIDDMDRETGGGFALSVGSHRVPWRFDAYHLTGATYTLPEHGYLDAEDMFRQRNAGTCNIKNVAPEFHRMLEERKRVYSVQAGDVIFHTRWLFHRTVPFHGDFLKRRGFLKNQQDRLLYRRYSVRYSPSDAIVPEGFGTELSKLYDDENKGTLEDISNRGDAWYPKCWPNVEQTELDNILNELPSKIAIAETRQKQVMKEMKPYLQEIGKQMSRSRLNGVIPKSPHPKDSSDPSSDLTTSAKGDL